MKKILFFVVLLVLFCRPAYSSVTTADGLITLNYYEDTQSGIENRWILDFSVNDIGGGVDSIKFGLTFYNEEVDFLNAYNLTSTEYYNIGYYADIPNGIFPKIGSNAQKLWIPVNTDFTFYTTNQFLGTPLVADFFVSLSYVDNNGISKGENFYLQGPIGPAVPEPIGMFLFAFGAFLIKVLIK
ncbi:MAG: hypothetical protein AB1454_04060 [Candidatus Auribacterota bacterium]